MAASLPRLQQLIKTGQIEQAREYLSILSSRLDSEKQEVIEILALAPDKTALSLLTFLIEKITLDNKTRKRLFQLTTDRAHLNFTFARILLDHGDQSQLIHCAPLFKHILSKETNEDLLHRIIRTAGKLKLKILTDDVAEFIFYDHMALKADAIKALKRIGSKLALERLEQVALTDKCDQDILDAIDILTADLAGALPAETLPVETGPYANEQPKEDDSFKTNLILLTSGRVEDRYKAFNYFSTRGSQVVSALTDRTNKIDKLDKLDHDLLVNLLSLTARTIPSQAIACLYTLISEKKLDSQIRFSVYNALEAFPKLESAAGMIKGISDPSMYVRTAAIRALERHCSDYIVAEIKNKIESGTKVGEMLVHTILDARAVCLIEALMSSDTFSYITSNYLEKIAAVQVIEAYISVLEKRNLKSTAKKFTRLRDQKAGFKQKGFILVSSSRSFLDVYAKLIDTCGYGTRTFVDTQEAFESVMVEKPAAIVCDLFLNHMTGMDFADEVREMYSPQELPIIISSLQKGLSGPEFDANLEKSKVNIFCDFPARPNQINSWLN